MYIIAMLTMVIDHMGLVFAPGDDFWRMIGRIAMPIYAYCLVLGYRHTRSRSAYLQRLTLLALISQVPYIVALKAANINIIGTFVICLAVLIGLDRIKPKAAGLVFAAAGLVLLELLPFDYGAYALLLILAYRYLPENRLIVAHLVLNVAYVLYHHGGTLQLYSVISTIFLVYRPTLYVLLDKIQIKRWVWRSFYPAHLVVLAVAEAALQGGWDR